MSEGMFGAVVSAVQLENMAEQPFVPMALKGRSGTVVSAVQPMNMFSHPLS